ncbi:MAG TPA: ABC transporter ATP-binding protein [Alphaproteobacteria bacterium]|nr:ABC transporter ATP-binding protein [Alphaproteobacteria bacterium]
MASVQLDSVTVDFPVYSANTRSLKNSLLEKGAGGRIGRGQGMSVSVRALDNVSLTFEHGDRIGLVGRNGAGKTTLLRVLGGVYQPTMGTVRRLGHVSSLLNISLGLDGELTGYENIMMRGLFLGLRPAEIRARTEEIAAFTELGDYLAMPAHTYSTGMMLRLAFAVCTCIEPEILLMDEWIGVGDAAFMEKAQRRLESFVGSAGIVVLASHNPALIERVCTKAVLLEGGRIAASGPVKDVLQQYG